MDKFLSAIGCGKLNQDIWNIQKWGITSQQIFSNRVTMLPRIEIDGIDYVNRLHKSASP